jgi:hypothetical protein
MVRELQSTARTTAAGAKRDESGGGENGGGGLWYRGRIESYRVWSLLLAGGS